MEDVRTASQQNNQVVCRFFLSNKCREGDRCRFSHDTSTGVVDPVCKFFQKGMCRFGAECNFDHVRQLTDGRSEIVSRGKLVADILHNNNETANTEQQQLVALGSRKTAQPASAVQKTDEHSESHATRSASLECVVCLEVVLEKNPPSARKFGILESCNHIFCLDCIRQWRKVKDIETKTVRGCPECRIASDFVTPSAFFVSDGAEKTALIQGYKAVLANVRCKYFERSGRCPFGNACFYKHALADGSPAPDLGPPTVRRDRRRTFTSSSFDSDREFVDELLRVYISFGGSWDDDENDTDDDWFFFQV